MDMLDPSNSSWESIGNITHLVSIPSVEEYYDRLLMFCELGKYVQQQHIYLRSDKGITSHVKREYPNSTFTVYRGNDNAIDKAKYLYRFLKTKTKQESPTIVHDTLEPTMVVLQRLGRIRKLKNVRYIVSLYFPNSRYYFEKGWENLKYPLSCGELANYKRMLWKRALGDRIASKLCDGIVGNSLEICESIVEYYNYPRERTAVIPTAIDLKRIHRIKKREAKSSDEKTILYVGSIQPRKEVELAIEAVGALVNDYKIHARLVIAGKYDMTQSNIIKQIIHKNSLNGRVYFTGKVDFAMLSELYSMADCLVFPSRWEGSPRVVKEALAFGCPVVAADIPGNRIIDPDGSAICFVKNQSKYDYVKSIIGLIEKPGYIPLGFMGKFSPETVAKKYLLFCKRIIELA